MTDQETRFAPVKVHIVADATRGTPAPAVPRKKAVTLSTVLLTTTNPAQLLLNENPQRREAWIIPSGDGEFLITRSETNANQNAGLASNATGSALGTFVPKTAITAPIPAHTTDPVWASGTTGVLGAASVRIGVIEILDE